MYNLTRRFQYRMTEKKAKELLNLSVSSIVDAIALSNDKIVYITKDASVMIRRNDSIDVLFEASMSLDKILEKIGDTTFVYSTKDDVSICYVYAKKEFRRHNCGIKGAQFVKRISDEEFVVVTDKEIVKVILGTKFKVKISRYPTNLYWTIENVFVSPDAKVFIRSASWSKVVCFRKTKKGDYVKTKSESGATNRCSYYAHLGYRIVILDSLSGKICYVSDAEGTLSFESSFYTDGSMKFNSIVSFDSNNEFYVCINDRHESFVRKCTIKNGEVRIGNVVAIFNSPDCRIIKGSDQSLFVVDTKKVFKIKL